MARLRNSSGGTIEKPNNSVDPAEKYINGKLCFPSFVEESKMPNGIFNSKIPGFCHPHNEISGKGRNDSLNLYNWEDESPNHAFDPGTDLKTI